MRDSSNIYVGLDVHKTSIAMAVAYAGWDKPQYYGEIRGLTSSTLLPCYALHVIHV